MAKLHHAVKLKQIGVRWVPGGGMMATAGAGPLIEDASGNVARMTRQRALAQAQAHNGICSSSFGVGVVTHHSSEGRELVIWPPIMCEVGGVVGIH